MAAVDDIPRSWSLSSLAALAVIAVAPPWLAVSFGVSWSIVAAGATIWLASVLFKRLLIQGARRVMPFELRSDVSISVLQGVVSAVVELAAAAAYLSTLKQASLAEVLAFGAGAGSAEAAYVLVLGIAQRQTDDEELRAWFDGARVSWCVRYAVPIERLFALIGHVGARGLLYVMLLQWTWPGIAWGLAAMLLFAAIDGVAVYGHLQKWQWHDPPICRRVHAYFAVLSLAELALLLLAFP